MRAVLFALSAGSKIGLAVVAGLFIVFALASALLIPRFRPEFPGSRRLPLFIAATIVLFLATMVAVQVFGREEEEAEAHEAAAGETIEVSGIEFKLALSSTELSAGSYELELTNDGSIGHNLVVSGPGVDKASTPVIEAGESARLKVELKAGSYKLYCSVPGHEEAGMRVQVSVR